MNKIICICLLAGFLMCNNVVFSQQNCDCESYSGDVRKNFEKVIKSGNVDEAIKIFTAQRNSTNPCCQAIGYTMESIVNDRLNKKDSSFVSAIKALAILKGKYHPFATLESLNILGQYYFAKKNIDSMGYFYLEGIELAKKNKEYLQEAKLYNNFARAFMSMKQLGKGLEYQKKSVEAALLTNDNAAFAQAYANLATCYGIIHEKNKDSLYLDSLQQANLLSLKYARLAGATGFIMRAYHTTAQVYIDKGDFQQTLKYNDTLLTMVDEKTNPQMLLNIYRVRGTALYELKQYAKSVEAFEMAKKYMALLNDPAIEKEMSGLMYKAYKANGDIAESLKILERYKDLSDSAFNKENSAIIVEMEQKYKKVENEKIIQQQEQQKKTYLLLALAGFFATVAIAFFLRQQSLKHKKNILETEQRLNRARMNPHFFFNALTTLQKFALRDNDGQAMASNLSKFSNIMRETLESTYKEYVTIEQEIDFLNEYLEVQKIRFPQTFSYEVMADKELEIDELQIPAMIIQPFVENSIEHGFVGVDYAGKITVYFTKDNKELQIQIADNGKGLSTTAKENNEHISRASQIIKDRIYLLNIKLKTKAGFSIDNNSTGNGVIVKIHLPLLYKEQSNA
jgi:two-component sensor histidine kinase